MDEDPADVTAMAHAQAVLRCHPWRLRRSPRWRWYAPWRLDRLCRRCAMAYPCPSVRRAHRTLAGVR